MEYYFKVCCSLDDGCLNSTAKMDLVPIVVRKQDLTNHSSEKAKLAEEIEEKIRASYNPA